MSSERGKSEFVERGKRVDGGRGLGGRMGLRGEEGGRMGLRGEDGGRGGRMGLRREVQPRRWHSLQSLLCHTRWDNPIHSQFPLPKILHFCIFCIFLPYKVGQSNALSISSLQTIAFLHLCIFLPHKVGQELHPVYSFPTPPYCSNFLRIGNLSSVLHIVHGYFCWKVEETVQGRWFYKLN